jgi:hypothetical protein
MNILDIEVAMIAAVNGPVRLHSEYILLAHIVLATPSTVLQDKPISSSVSSPGMGSTCCDRAAATSSSPTKSSQRKSRRPTSLSRARELVEGLAELPPLTTRYRRIVLSQKLRRCGYANSPTAKARRFTFGVSRRFQNPGNCPSTSASTPNPSPRGGN